MLVKPVSRGVRMAISRLGSMPFHPYPQGRGGYAKASFGPLAACLVLNCAYGHHAKETIMKGKVTEQGLLIPKRLLEGVEEVDIQKRGSITVVSPVGPTDPVLHLGTEPVCLEIKDASENHDRYIY